MNNSELVQIADILPPMAPAAPADNFWLYFLLLTAIVAATAYGHLHSAKQVQKLRLKWLRRQYQQQNINNRQCAFQLANLLQKNAPHQYLSTSTFSPAQNKQTFSNTLQIACYSRHGLDDDAMLQLLTEAEHCLSVK